MSFLAWEHQRGECFWGEGRLGFSAGHVRDRTM